MSKTVYSDHIPVVMHLPKNYCRNATYELQKDLEVCGRIIPAGYCSDGATVPRVFWWLFPPIHRYFHAAVLHDYLVDSNAPWAEANDWFKKALVDTQITRWRRKLMVAAVKLYGWYKVTLRGDS